MQRPDAMDHCPLLPHTATGAPCAASGCPVVHLPEHVTPVLMVSGQVQAVLGDNEEGIWLGQGAACKHHPMCWYSVSHAHLNKEPLLPR